MTVADWLISARLDAERRGLDDVVPVLEALAGAIAALRAADFDPRLKSAAADSGGEPIESSRG